MKIVLLSLRAKRGNPGLIFWIASAFCLAMTLAPQVVSASALQKQANNLGLVLYMPMNEGTSTIAGDFSGKGNKGTLTNGPTWTTGKIGGAINFDGDNDYVKVATFPKSTSQYTVSAWVYAQSAATWGTIAKNWGSAIGGQFHFGFDDATGKISNYLAESDNTTIGPVIDTVAMPLNSWQFVTAIADGSNLRLYRNGVEVGTPVYYDGTLASTINSVTFGDGLSDDESTSKNQRWDGLIDEVRIYNRALGATEVANLYNSSLGSKYSSSMNSVLTNGLVGLWSFDGADMTATTAYDRSGSNNNGTLTGGPAKISGKIGQALNFKGAQRVALGAPSAINLSTNYTLSMWIYPRDTNYVVILRAASGSTYDPNKKYALRLNAGNLYFITGDGTTADSDVLITTVTNGSWQMLTCTLDSSNVKSCYKNGLLTATSTNSVDTSLLTPTMDNIGSDDDGGGFFNGLIDDVRIYNRALSQEEVTRLYNMGSVAVNKSMTSSLTSGLVLYHTFDGSKLNTTTSTDSSVSAINGTLGGGTASKKPVPISGKIGQAMKFDGVDDYVSMADASSLRFGTGAMSVAAWIKPPNSNQNGIFVGKRIDAPYTQYSMSVTGADSFLGGSGKKISWTAIEGSPGNNRGVYTNSDVADGNWHHVVGVNTGSSLLIYVDGVSVAVTADHTNGSWPNTDNTNPLGIGSSIDAGSPVVPFKGSIDDVRVYNRALSAGEVLQLYNMGK